MCLKNQISTMSEKNSSSKNNDNVNEMPLLPFTYKRTLNTVSFLNFKFLFKFLF